MKRGKRIGAAFMAAALLIGQQGATACAEGPPDATGGLCEHHTAHDAACGYVEAQPGQPCVHTHTTDCYTDELICGLDEGAEQAATGSDAGHQHGQECYALDCAHERGEHDDACGYVEAVEGTPCGYVCDQCGKEPDKDSGEAGTTGGNGLPTPGEPEPIEPPETQVWHEAELLAGLDPDDKNNDGYHDGDVEVINGMIDNNGLSAAKDDPASWETAGLVAWDSSTPKRISKLNLYSKGLTGTLNVGNLTNLTKLSCSNNQLTGTLDVRKLTNLTYLSCSNNQLTGTLDVGKLTNLTYLSCSNNQLTGTLDVGKLTNLTELYCGNNELTGTLDVGKLTNLTVLSCYKNELTGTLDVGNLTVLTSLSCYNNQLDTLDVGNLKALTYLNCGSNQLDKLDVGNLTALTSLSCGSNQLDTLDVGNLTALTYLSCYNNQLDTLDVGNLKALTYLSCGSNQLDKLDVGNLTALTSLYCGSNQLDKLDVGNLTALTSLYCGSNQLDKLNVGNLTALTSLSCGDNPYTSFSTKDGHTLTVTPATGGKVWLTDFNNNSSVVRLNATPDSGYVFKEWTALPAGASNAQTTSFTLDSNITVAAAFRSLHTDATLKSLSLSDGELTPAFNPAVTSYTATVDNSVSSVTITAEANDSKANVSGDTGVKPLNEGVNPFTVTVTAEDGTKKEYEITITRKAASTDATLKSLSLSDGVLTPAFDPATTSYNATVDYSVSNVTITAKANSNKASVSGDTGAKTLNEGENPFTVTVTAEDGGTQKEYTVTITREKAPTPSGGGGGSGSGGSSGGSSSGGSSSGGSSSHDSYPIITAPQPPKPTHPVLAVIELPVTVGNGTATGKPDDGRTASAIAEAQRNAKARTNGIAVQYDAKTALAYDRFSITIQRATLDRLIAAKVKVVTLNTGIADLTFDLASLQEIQKQATGDITLTAARETGLTGDALAAVGSRPAYRLAVSYTGRDGKAAAVQDFGAGRVTVGLAYKPAENEQTGSLFLVYSKDGGSAQWFTRSSYDRTSGNVLASTGHFSVYGVGYKPAPAFTDAVNHWAKADIDFVASRGLLAGTGDATFSPETAVTQGQFSAALDKLAGRSPDEPANPNAAITREQMALIIKQYAAKWGYTLPVAREAETFADDSKIRNNTYRKAIQSMQQAGIMSGKGDRRFGPRDTATRAEAAAVLRRFVEIVIDPAAADGWSQNDAGRWLYYENNKPVTGWKQIDRTWYCFDAAGLMQAGGWREIGGKWYYFFPDGAMAVNTKIDGYEIGPDGARKE